jgi:hypothetical protein
LWNIVICCSCIYVTLDTFQHIFTISLTCFACFAEASRRDGEVAAAAAAGAANRSSEVKQSGWWKK